MAAAYRLSGWRRAVNALVRGLLRLGLAPPRTYLLTVPGRRSGRPRSTPVTLVEAGADRWLVAPYGAVPGRRSGRPRSTPVTLVEAGADRWLVAPYGAVGWVHNVRAAGRATLSRGRRVEPVALVELGPDESAPVLRRYVAEVPVTRPFFDVRPDAPLAAFAAEASRHPVFRIVPTTSTSEAARRTSG